MGIIKFQNLHLHFSGNYTESCKSGTHTLLSCTSLWINLQEGMAQPRVQEKQENAAVLSSMSGGQKAEIPTASAAGGAAAICWSLRRSAPHRQESVPALSLPLGRHRARCQVGASKDHRRFLCPQEAGNLTGERHLAQEAVIVWL